jgi:hypothetical protein
MRKTDGGEGGDSLRSEGSTQGGGSFAPHGGGRDHRRSPESRGDARSPERRGKLGLGFLLGGVRGGG